jgi:TonB family protein
MVLTLAASVGLHAAAAWAVGWWARSAWHLKPIHVISLRLLDKTAPEGSVALEADNRAKADGPARQKKVVHFARMPPPADLESDRSRKTLIVQKPLKQRVLAEASRPLSNPPPIKTLRPSPGPSFALEEPTLQAGGKLETPAEVSSVPVDRALLQAKAEPQDESDRSYRLEAIRNRIQKALVYPKAARQFGWEGTARVRIVLAPDGQLSSLLLESSSQIGVLDKEVLAAVRRGAPYPYVEGAIVVPVVFDLRSARP